MANLLRRHVSFLLNIFNLFVTLLKNHDIFGNLSRWILFAINRITRISQAIIADLPNEIFCIIQWTFRFRSFLFFFFTQTSIRYSIVSQSWLSSEINYIYPIFCYYNFSYWHILILFIYKLSLSPFGWHFQRWSYIWFNRF